MRGQFTKRLLGVTLAASAAVTALGGAAAHASPVPPVADIALPGTWVNTNVATRSVKQVVITRGEGGRINVDAFGSCSPSLCEWGLVPALERASLLSQRGKESPDLERLQRRERRLTVLNCGLGITVLILTAIATSI